MLAGYLSGSKAAVANILLFIAFSWSLAGNYRAWLPDLPRRDHDRDISGERPGIYNVTEAAGDAEKTARRARRATGTTQRH